MPRTIRTKVYKFSELSNDAQKAAIENLYDINLDYDWWEFNYEDAKNVGIEITGFDLDRYCSGKIDDCNYTANKILEEHGDICETYKSAKHFIDEYNSLVEKYSDGKTTNVVTEDNEYDFDNEADELEKTFKESLLEDYRILLRQEYEYRSSEPAILETIQANEYEFYANGKLI